jgi:DNA-binding MarR family transcriptional regulator
MTTLVDKVNHNATAMGEAIAEEIHQVRHLFIARRYSAAPDGAQDLARMEARTVLFVSRRAGATHSDLVTHLTRDKGQVARLVATLRDRGLLVARTDSADRRVQRLDLTVKGRTALAAIQRERQQVAKESVAGLTANERQELLTLLRKVRRNLEAD